MSGYLKRIYLGFCSKPRSDRRIYKTIARDPVRSILEIGVGPGVRAKRMIQWAADLQADQAIRYTGVDLFETRGADDGPGLSLKEAHRTLRTDGVVVQLVPGDPHAALARTANSLPNTDLVIISADQDAGALEQAWFYVPRMLHEGSQVFVEQLGADGLRQMRLVSRHEIEQLASRRRARRAA